jgi:predicted hotdog family 3-hydroxylacyl-ACP dehydratase
MRGFHTGLMAHRPPMLLVDDLTAPDTATLTVRPDNIFLTGSGVLSRAGLLEFLAQSFSAADAYRAWLAGIRVPPGGYLVGLEHAEFHGDAAIGDTLTATVRRDGNVGRVVMASGEVRRGDTLLASANFRVFGF